MNKKVSSYEFGQTAANPVLYIILVAVQQQQQNKTKKRTHVRVFTSPFSRQLL
jgi:hypothetical protein